MSAKKIFYISMLGILVLFIVQNIESTTVVFMLWKFTLPRAIILTLTFGLGFLTHYVFFNPPAKANVMNKDQESA